AYMAKGYENVEGNFWERVDKVKTFRRGRDTVHVIPKHVLAHAYPNMFVVDENEFVGYVQHIDNDLIEMVDLRVETLMSQRLWGLTPRNLEQAMAFFLIQREEADMTVLTGPAGSGK